MKVYIGPYTNWIGPYQIAEFILFWMDRHEDDRVHKFGTWLDEKVPGLTKLCLWLESKKKRKIKVRLDPYDTWSLDNTLAYIILPGLKQLRDTSQSFGYIEDSDAPPEMCKAIAEDQEDFYDSNAHKRWVWALNEMIFAFECKINDDWDEQFWSGEWGKAEFEDAGEELIDGEMVKLSKPLASMMGTRTCDWEGRQKMQDRISNGFRLFGKYYEALWD